MTRHPRHPGQVILRDYLGPRRITGRRLARTLGVPNSRMNNVLRGKGRLDAELALRLAKALGGSGRGWLAMQTDYDLWAAKRKVDLRTVGSLKRS